MEPFNLMIYPPKHLIKIQKKNTIFSEINCHMPMKPTKRGRDGLSGLPQVAVLPVYEDFRPVFERQRDEEAENILVYLSGFSKEKIRVSIKGKTTVRIRGEHLVAGNKWSRFQEDFPTPEDCNMKTISARFENGILTITMPTKKHFPYEVKETQKTPTTPPEETQRVPPPINSENMIEGHNKPTLQKLPSKHDLPPKVASSQEKDDNYEDNAKQKEKGDNQITSSTRIYTQAIKCLTEPCEKRQLLMDGGAVVLVIVALGAYISLQYRDRLG